MNSLRLNILKSLAYFDYFDHPLTAIEICAFMPCRYSLDVLKKELLSLVNAGLIFKPGRFYALRNDPFLVERRMAGHLSAVEELVTAKKIAGFLSRLPFVETIAVSGSLSKYYADENTDIDFFIITSANRLWLARSIMHFFKKISFIAGKQHWFCMNYYVDEIKLEIPEKNLFTAIEIVTLMPLEGGAAFNKFIESNNWVSDFLPGYTFSANAREIKRGIVRKVLEGFLNLKFFDRLENQLMMITARRWQKKAKESELRFDSRSMGMAVDKHFSKPDPAIFQKKFLNDYECRISQYAETWFAAEEK